MSRLDAALVVVAVFAIIYGVLVYAFDPWDGPP